jgi:hypothetical protein
VGFEVCRADGPLDDSRERVERLEADDSLPALFGGCWGCIGSCAAREEEIEDACFKRGIESFVMYQIL